MTQDSEHGNLDKHNALHVKLATVLAGISKDDGYSLMVMFSALSVAGKASSCSLKSLRCFKICIQSPRVSAYRWQLLTKPPKLQEVVKRPSRTRIDVNMMDERRND